MMQKHTQTAFPACIQAAVIAGLMMLGIPSGVADGSVTPDVSSESTQIPEPTQTRAEQTAMPLPEHADSHAKRTGSESLDAGKPDETANDVSVNHKEAKDRARLTRQGVESDKSGTKVTDAMAKTFDMNVLIERLKETDAIGMFTKLALRSDALDLMAMIKAYNKHMDRYSLKELRARFDGLLLKVMALLDDDPGLSRDISLAREDIWKSLLTNKDRSRAAVIYPYPLAQEVKV